MMLLQLLLAAVAVAGDRVVVNRRARQRHRQVTTTPPDPELHTSSDINTDFDRRFRVQNAFSLALANSDGFGAAETIYGQNFSAVPAVPASYYDLTTEAGVTQARVPRRRTQLTRGRDQARSAQGRTEAPPAPSVTRSRARIPRRRINPNRDLERNERNTFSVEKDTATVDVTSPRRLNNNILDTADPGAGRSATKSRSRSRFRSRGSAPSAPGTTARPSQTTPASVRGRGRTVSRARPRPEARDFSRAEVRDLSDNRPAPKKTAASRPSSAKVIFPRKDLFPKLNKYSLTQAGNEVDTGSFVSSDSYKLTKERLKSSLTKV